MCMLPLIHCHPDIWLNTCISGTKNSVFVNGRSRAAIMEDMDRRITRGDFEAEKTEAINVLSPPFLSPCLQRLRLRHLPPF